MHLPATSSSASTPLRHHRTRIRSPALDDLDTPGASADDVDVAVPSRAADMNKSLFSMIKAAGRPETFQNRFDDVSSDDEVEEEKEEDIDNDDNNRGLREDSGKDLRKRSHEIYGVGPEPLMEASQILTPVRQATQSSTDSAPFLSMILKGEAHMEASEHAEAPEAVVRIAEPEEPSPVSLAQRLKEIFELDEPEEVVSEYPCWLLHTVLLSGHLYITTKHICFYAYCPKLSTTTVKSGWLRKRGHHNPRYRPYYMELKGDVLRYYNDRSDIYMPSGHIDLRFGISATVEPQSKKIGKDESSYFKVVTKEREYWFKADTHESAREWVKHLQRVIFRSHNSGDSVKICLPIPNIIDVEEEQVLDVSDTVKLRVLENLESFGLDEVSPPLPTMIITDFQKYYFSFFEGGQDAIRMFHQFVEKNLKESKELSLENIEGATRPRTPRRRSLEAVKNTLQPFALDESGSRRSSFESSRSNSETEGKSRSRSQRRTKDDDGVVAPSRSPRTTSLSSPAIQSVDLDMESSPAVQSIDESNVSASQILNRSDVFQAPTSHVMRHFSSDSEDSDTRKSRKSHETARVAKRRSTEGAVPSIKTQASSVPTTSQSSSLQDIVRSGVYPLNRVTQVARYIHGQSKRLTTESYEKVKGAWTAPYKHYGEDVKGVRPDDDIIEHGDSEHYAKRFREHFALPDSEPLVATYYAWFIRLLNNYGKIYIGKRYVCYRSFHTRTKLIFPIDKIESVKKVKNSFLKDAYRQYEMIITAQGHEALWFAFSSPDSRDDCYGSVLRAMDAVENTQKEDGSLAQAAIAEYESLQGARSSLDVDRSVAKRLSESGNEEAPPILFDDPNVSFLVFKPPKPMRITLLTIGSRGDVQPFIALGKGLIAEGHSVRVATHAEFEPWIRKHGLDFAPVAGDPGELMRLCIEYGMFSLQFLYEAKNKFSAWIDELLLSAWNGCQDTDLLIESPSTMAGIHIAEALKIPYFRAFTMPWTKTRAYPHAFSVSETKRGGNFNYLSYVIIDQVFWRGISGNVNKWRKRTLGLPSTSFDQMQANKVPFLYNFSPSVVPAPLDYPDWIRVTGYWFLDEGDVWTPPPELVAFMAKAKADGKKLVYIGFGSILVENPAALTRTIVDAIKQADVRCILAKGWSERQTKTIVPAAQQQNPDQPAVPPTDEEVVLPPEIYSVKSIPHDWLFPQMDCIVHHGGSGTTGASLRAGVPTIVKPFFGDQFFFASRVEDLGVGVCLRRLNQATFWRALRDATTDRRMVLAAKRLGDRIRREDGVRNAINAIYRDLDYARSLIKRGGTVSKGEDGGSGEEIEEHWTFVEPESGTELST
jgi:sterol 3beta-glucosyltransferase